MTRLKAGTPTACTNVDCEKKYPGCSDDEGNMYKHGYHFFPKGRVQKTPHKGGLTTRFDPPPNDLRELKLRRSSANGCTKRKILKKIFFDIRFRC